VICYKQEKRKQFYKLYDLYASRNAVCLVVSLRLLWSENYFRRGRKCIKNFGGDLLKNMIFR
jgi:hypothetical protein